MQTPAQAPPAPAPQPTYQQPNTTPVLNSQSLQSLLSKLQQSTQQHGLPSAAPAQDPYGYYQQQNQQTQQNQQQQQGYNYNNNQQRNYGQYR
jgi:hypothetical protein